MSWLIESYLEEGKHGPDHPESLNMKNMEDMRKKHKDIERKKYEDIHVDSYSMKRDAACKKLKNMYDKVNATKDADIAGKKAILKGQDYDEAKKDYVDSKINFAKDKSEKNGEIIDDYGHGMMLYDVAKSIRRNKEKNKKRSNNECAWIVESLQ